MNEFDINHVRRLDGALLLVFHELLQRRKAAEVADVLGLSPSAVSHALTRLRDLFDDPLFIRKPHGLAPTRRALELGPQVEALIKLADATLGRDQSFDPAVSTRAFTIAAPEFVTDLIGAPLIAALKKAAPRVMFSVSFLPQAQALEALRRGEVDLALGRFGPALAGFEAELLYEDHYCVAARKGHPRIRGEIDFQAYAQTGHVYATSGSESAGDMRWPTNEAITTLATVPQWLTALVMVASSDAIATCPRRLAERHADMLGLQVLDPPFEPLSFEISAVRRGGSQDAGVNWFLDQVRRAVA